MDVVDLVPRLESLDDLTDQEVAELLRLIWPKALMCADQLKQRGYVVTVKTRALPGTAEASINLTLSSLGSGRGFSITAEKRISI